MNIETMSVEDIEKYLVKRKAIKPATIQEVILLLKEVLAVTLKDVSEADLYAQLSKLDWTPKRWGWEDDYCLERYASGCRWDIVHRANRTPQYPWRVYDPELVGKVTE